VHDEEDFTALQFHLFNSQLVSPRVWFEGFCTIAAENMVEHPVQPRVSNVCLEHPGREILQDRQVVP
jgi:hypothetical protein